MKGRKLRKGVLAGMICGLAIALIAGAALLYLRGKRADRQPDVLLAQYMEYLEGRLQPMYGMLDAESRERVGKEEFLERHQNIYDGIEANNFQTEVTGMERPARRRQRSPTIRKMDSVAGGISFDHQAVFIRDKEKGYALPWNDSMIFPQLTRPIRSGYPRCSCQGKVLDRTENACRSRNGVFRRTRSR